MRYLPIGSASGGGSYVLLDAQGNPSGKHPDKGTLHWHTDGSWRERTGQATMMYSEIVPQTGGYGVNAPLTPGGPPNGEVALGRTHGTRTLRFRIDYRVLIQGRLDTVQPAGLAVTDLTIAGVASGNTSAKRASSSRGPSAGSVRGAADRVNRFVLKQEQFVG